MVMMSGRPRVALVSILYVLLLCCPSLLPQKHLKGPSRRAENDKSTVLDREKVLDTIRASASLVAGLYEQLPSYTEQVNLNKTVLVTACNSGYLPHLLNFDCFMKRLGLKYMVFSLDDQLHLILQQRHKGIISVPYGSARIKSASSTFRSRQFNLITNRKEEAVLSILTLGYDAIFIDVDIAVVKDPIPQLILPGYDYVHSVNIRCATQRDAFDYTDPRQEGNTGLYYVKSNAKSVAVWKLALHASLKQKGLDDQTLFWNTIRGMKFPQFMFTRKCIHGNVSLEKELRAFKGSDSTLHERWVACPLDACSFSSGSLLGRYGYQEMMQVVKDTNRTIFSLHANFVTGANKKQYALQRHGFWLTAAALGPGGEVMAHDDSCKGFSMLIPKDLPKGGMKITKAKAS